MAIITDLLNRIGITTAQMNALTAIEGLVSGSEILNSDTGTIWRYNGTIWEDKGSGGGGTDDQNASEVPTTPYLTITSTDVQAFMQELKDEIDAVNAQGTGIVAEGIVSDATSGDHVITHNLGYAPSFQRMGFVFSNSTAIAASASVYVQSVTSTVVNIRTTNTPASTDLYWHILGTDTATPLVGSEVVSLIDTELGQTTWKSGGGGSTTFDGLTDTDINSPTSGQYLEWNGSAWVNVNAPSGSLTTAQANSIANSRKVEPNWETSGRALTLDDFIQQDSGKEQTRSGLGVDDGGSYTFTLSDTVITSALALNLPLPIYAVGSTIIIELENGSTYQFKDYSGTTGDIWTITNSSGAAILKTGNVITSGGVISNSAPPATYTDGNALNGIINENDLDGITGAWNPADFDVTVIVDPEDAGKFAVRVERLAATGTAYDFDIPLTGLLSGTTYSSTLRAQRTAAANYFQLRLRTVSGWTSDDTQTPTSSFSDMNFAAQAATSTPPVLNIRAIGGGTTGDILIIKDLIVTAQ